MAKSTVSSLASVLERCCPGRSLHKQLVDVRKVSPNRLILTLTLTLALILTLTLTLTRALTLTLALTQVNWHDWPLNDAEAVNYAMNDAYASALALRRLRHPSRFTPPPLPPPTPTPPTPPPQPAAAAASRLPLPEYFAQDDADEESDGDWERSEASDVSDVYEALSEEEEEEDDDGVDPGWAALRHTQRMLRAEGQYVAGGEDGLGAFASLDPQLQADLMGTCDKGAAAPIMSEEDEREADDGEHGAASAEAGGGEPVRDAVRQTVLRAASQLITQWMASGDAQPLELPACLTDTDRSSLHAFCQSHGLHHVTFGEPGSRQLRVSRRQPGGGSSDSLPADSPPAEATSFAADIMSALQFIEAWGEVLIKYDPRHWMGNWFLMAQSKSSALFKFFCTATSDAMFEEREGERGRVKEHLRKIFKQLDVVDTARWGNLAPAGQAAERGRVDGLIARVPRAYWRSHCKATIPPPERLARRLLMVYYFFKDMVSLTLALT